jgi:hypothetical protein
MALAPRTDQNMPEHFGREPITEGWIAQSSRHCVESTRLRCWRVLRSWAELQPACLRCGDVDAVRRRRTSCSAGWRNASSRRGYDSRCRLEWCVSKDPAIIRRHAAAYHRPWRRSGGVVQLVGTPACHVGGGRRFEPRRPRHPSQLQSPNIRRLRFATIRGLLRRPVNAGFSATWRARKNRTCHTGRVVARRN